MINVDTLSIGKLSGKANTKELPGEILRHGFVVADEDITSDGLVPRQRFPRRQRLESLVHGPSSVVVVVAVAVVVIVVAVGVLLLLPQVAIVVNVVVALLATAGAKIGRLADSFVEVVLGLPAAVFVIDVVAGEVIPGLGDAVVGVLAVVVYGVVAVELAVVVVVGTEGELVITVCHLPGVGVGVGVGVEVCRQGG